MTPSNFTPEAASRRAFCFHQAREMGPFLPSSDRCALRLRLSSTLQAAAVAVVRAFFF